MSDKVEALYPYVLDKEEEIIHKRLCKHVDSISGESKIKVLTEHDIPAYYEDCNDCKPKVHNKKGK